jgi:hypothetical protein
VIEHCDAVFVAQDTQARALAAFGRLGQAQEQFRDACAKPCIAHGCECSGGLHQGFAGTAGLRNRDKARRCKRQIRKEGAVAFRVEIVHEMQARPGAQRTDPRHRMTGELRQRLAAEARSTGSEDHNVGCSRGELAAGFADCGEIVAAPRQLQEGQAAIAIARYKPGERFARAPERVVVSSRIEARGLAREFDRLNDRLFREHGCDALRSKN